MEVLWSSRDVAVAVAAVGKFDGEVERCGFEHHNMLEMMG